MDTSTYADASAQRQWRASTKSRVPVADTTECQTPKEKKGSLVEPNGNRLGPASFSYHACHTAGCEGARTVVFLLCIESGALTKPLS